jgi:hypothetical protein
MRPSPSPRRSALGSLNLPLNVSRPKTKALRRAPLFAAPLRHRQPAAPDVIATDPVYPHPPGKTGSRDKHRPFFETAASRLPQDEVFS